MTLAYQEQLMFELLFDDELRAEFCQSPKQCMAMFDLSESQQQDFLAIRLDALEQEAAARKNMIASQLSKDMPLSVALLSSFEYGFDLVLSALQPYVLKENRYQRVCLLIKQILARLDELSFLNALDQHLLTAVLQVEWMINNKAQALDAELESKLESELKSELKPRLDSEPAISNAKCSGNFDSIESIHASLADYFSADMALKQVDKHKGAQSLEADAEHNVQALAFNVPLSWHRHAAVQNLPLSYWLLYENLVSVELTKLWRYLKQDPILPEQRLDLLAQIDENSSRLLMIKPKLSFLSLTDSLIDIQLLELIDGFSPLLNQINGQRSLHSVLARFAEEGADDSVLEQVKQGFQRLYEHQYISLN